MDLINQTKLTVDEWNSIEKPISSSEKKIMKLIMRGIDDINIKTNDNVSFITFLKMEKENNLNSIHLHMYVNYILPKLKYNDIDLLPKFRKQKKLELNKLATSRIKNSEKYFNKPFSINKDKTQSSNSTPIYEFKLVELINNMFYLKHKNNDEWLSKYYTLKYLSTYNVLNLNTYLMEFITNIFKNVEICTLKLIKMAQTIIEKNKDILEYADNKLYPHQKKLFTLCKKKGPKLILLNAPTGTGKTCSPLGLSEKYKLIFVCAARHVGMALAKLAISMEKKIAFAFGCESPDDIKLHYFAAKDFIKNKKSGRIQKVDNTVGDKVEIMICDVKSYLPAMLYMKAFNNLDELILYWDEPTITLDYEEHELHDIVKKNWSENQIPNIVLSSATLPHIDELPNVVNNFNDKFAMFDENNVYSIVSHDCKKTIPIINSSGYIEMPHYLYEDYDEIKKISKHCSKYKTIMRYLDLQETIDFIMYINENKYFESNLFNIENNWFDDVLSINMENIKSYYIDLLGHIQKDKWPIIYDYFQKNRTKKYESSVFITTKDARTLTDGPTIYIAEDTNKIATFCVQQANIQKSDLTKISEAIGFNNNINDQLSVLSKKYEDGTKKDETKEKKMIDGRVDENMKQLYKKIEQLKNLIKVISLDKMYVPNTPEHQKRFGKFNRRSFAPNIEEHVIEKIMKIRGINDYWKVLLLLGIGFLGGQTNPEYIEIMKELASNQKLYIIIASSDYIYGTNYQFCHSYIGKDLGHMSQEKCIQAMGRTGREDIQKDYSIRFRDDNLILKLFKTDSNRPEVINMNKIFINDY